MPVQRVYKIRWPGVMFILVTLLLGVGAINSQNNLLFIVFGLVLGSLLVSGIVSGSMLMGVEVRRRPVPDGVVGERVPVAYVLRNTNRWAPAIAISIEEEAVIALESERRDGGGRAVSIAAFVTRTSARSSTRVSTSYTPPRRGSVSFTRITAHASFPLGVFRKSVVFDQPHTALVAPEPLRTRPGLIHRGSSSRERVHTTTRRQGRGEEFFALRDYAPGDPKRIIAWKPSARTGDLVVRQHFQMADTSLRITLLLDRPAASADPDAPAERTLRLVLGLIDEGLRAGLIPSVRVLPTDPSPVVVETRADLASLARRFADLDTMAVQRLGESAGRADGSITVRLSEPELLAPGGRAA